MLRILTLTGVAGIRSAIASSPSCARAFSHGPSRVLDAVSATDADRQAVEEVVSRYAQSLVQPDIAKLRTCFHKDATIFANVNGEIVGGNIEWLYDFMATNGGVTGLTFEVDVLRVTPTTATAEVRLYRESPAYEVTDYQSLVKQPNGEWKVLAKVYHIFQAE